MPASDSQSYAGDVSSEAAWELLTNTSEATLVDVRTAAEWAFVGIPDLGALAKEPILAEWQSYPSMAVDPAFAATLAGTLAARGIGADAPVLFLCRSGVRSRAAAIALTAAGFHNCLNVAGGFEGPADGDGHRGRVDGWKARGLPWRQS